MLSQTQAKPRRKSGEAERIEDFLGSAHVFALAISGLMEDRLLRDVAGEQLSSSQLKVLRLVHQFEAQTVSDIAAFLGVSNAAASKTVDRLVRSGLLRRSEGSSDRRASQLALSDRGQRLVREYQAQRKRRLEKIFRQFPPSALQQAAELLDQLAASIVTHSANPEEVCLQCGVYLRQRCLLQEVVRRSCSYHQRQRQKAAGQCAKDCAGNGSCQEPREGTATS